MKKTDILDLFAFLSGCYPLEFKSMSEDKLEQMVNSWWLLFCDKRFADLNRQRLMEGAKRHVMGECGHSFPTPRDVIEQLPGN